MSTQAFLLEKYGPLLTLPQVAMLLNRKPEGVRVTIQKNSGELGRQLSGARIKLGRRTHFKTSAIAKLLDGDPLCDVKSDRKEEAP